MLESNTPLRLTLLLLHAGREFADGQVQVIDVLPDILGEVVATAIGLFSTLASMATPCSVNAKGGAEVFLFDAITICDRIFRTSAPVSWNMKSDFGQ